MDLPSYKQIASLRRGVPEAFAKRLQWDLDKLFRPTLRLIRENCSLKMLLQENRDLLELCLNYLREIYSHFLFPWNDPCTTKNRYYFTHEGALDVVLQIYTSVLLHDWDSRGELLQKMEIRCLHILWNFSETADARQLMIDSGCFHMVLRSLMHSEEFHDKYTTNGLFYVATGCLSNWCELECCQLPVAQNTQIIKKLLLFTLIGPSEAIRTRMMIVNLFFRLTHSQQTHQYLIKPTVMEQLIAFSNSVCKHELHDLVWYILGLTFARLILFSIENIEECFLKQMTDSMKHFLLQAKLDVLHKHENNQQYNWITMLPFVDAAYTYGLKTTKLSNTQLKVSQSFETAFEENIPVFTDSSISLAKSLSLAYVIFALGVEVMRSKNTEVLMEQGLLDYIVMLYWGMKDEWRHQCQFVQDTVCKTITKPPAVPRLSSISKAFLARNDREYSGLTFGKIPV